MVEERIEEIKSIVMLMSFDGRRKDCFWVTFVASIRLLQKPLRKFSSLECAKFLTEKN